MLGVEVVLTLWDFVEEDRTRRLSALERVTHGLLTLNYGAVLGLLLWQMAGWAARPTRFAAVDHGWLAWLMLAYAVGVAVWAVRDLLAARALDRPAWRTAPIVPQPNARPMHVLVSGGTGFIGRALVRRLIEDGHKVIVLTRRRPKAEYLFGPHATAVERLDQIPNERPVHAVVNLAGAPVAGVPWTRGRKRVLLESRLATTRALVDWMAARPAQPPLVFVSGSAVGFYGDCGDEPVDETAAPKPGFLSELCDAWERIAREAGPLGVRVVLLRIGLVLGAGGGILPPLRLAYRLGLGGTVGEGRQWMPWIHRDDLVRLILHVVCDVDLFGPVNAVAPEPVRNEDFAGALAASVHRPARLHVPARAAHLALGEMSELLLAGQRAVPTRASLTGFRFRFPTLPEALDDLA
jgi:uncharacterized protein (TIGR01777 family)